MDGTRQATLEDFLKIFEGGIKRFEELPDGAKNEPILHRDWYTLLVILRGFAEQVIHEIRDKPFS